MELGTVMNYLYPDFKNGKEYVVANNGEGAFITSWNADVPQPTDVELQTAWQQIQANPPVIPLSAIEQLQKDQADLMFELVMKGVL